MAVENVLPIIGAGHGCRAIPRTLATEMHITRHSGVGGVLPERKLVADDNTPPTRRERTTVGCGCSAAGNTKGHFIDT